MSSSKLATPRPDEKLVLVIEILAPEGTEEYMAFDGKFTHFKQQLDGLVEGVQPGALKMKVVMKKNQDSSIVYKS